MVAIGKKVAMAVLVGLTVFGFSGCAAMGSTTVTAVGNYKPAEKVDTTKYALSIKQNIVDKSNSDVLDSDDLQKMADKISGRIKVSQLNDLAPLTISIEIKRIITRSSLSNTAFISPLLEPRERSTMLATVKIFNRQSVIREFEVNPKASWASGPTQMAYGFFDAGSTGEVYKRVGDAINEQLKSL